MSAQNRPVAVVDYGMGNMFSVRNACEHLQCEAKIVSSASEIMGASALILPGVGAFGDAIATLRKLDLVSPMRDFIASGRPFLGICLGMQLLMSEGQEFGTHEGLGIMKGTVKRLPEIAKDGTPLRVPHIGWSRISAPSDHQGAVPWSSSILAKVEPGSFVYFLHSYQVVPEDDSVWLSETEYKGIRFASGIAKGNVFGVQFHPERSGQVGLNILQKFIELTRS